MVDYQLAVAAVQDPNADPILLAKIAYENPEFGANVAVNPRAYPGLKRWLAEFGDERARTTLAQMGIINTAGPVVDRYEEAGTPDNSSNLATNSTVKPAVKQSVEQSSEQAEQESQPSTDDVNQLFNVFAQESQQLQNNTQQESSPQYTPELALNTSDPAIMHDIAQYAPQLHVYLAQNPYIYPELLNWLASLNEPQVTAVIQQRQR